MKKLFIIILLSILFIIIISHKNIDSFESTNFDWNTFYTTLKKDVTNDVLEQIKNEIRSGNFQVNTTSNNSLSEPVIKFLTYLFTPNNSIQNEIKPDNIVYNPQQTGIFTNPIQQPTSQPSQTGVFTNPIQQPTSQTIQPVPNQQQTIQPVPNQQQTIQSVPNQQQTIQPVPNQQQTVQPNQDILINNIKCPRDDVWFETSAGNISNLQPCGDGLVGNKFRRCGLDGNWSEVILTNCYPSSTVRA